MLLHTGSVGSRRPSFSQADWRRRQQQQLKLTSGEAAAAFLPFQGKLVATAAATSQAHIAATAAAKLKASQC